MTPLPPPPACAGSARRCLWLALALAAGLAAVDGVAAEKGALSVRAAVDSLETVLAGVACLLAARAFGRGDHLRRAWLLLGLSHLVFALLFTGDLLQVSEAAMPAWYTPTVTLATNLLRLSGTLLFASTWWRTGLPPPGSRGGGLATWALLLAGSAAVVGPDLVHYARAALEGDAAAAVLALGDLCDAAALLLVAPLVRTALALAGGSLAWPFGLMAAANLCWLLFDGLEVYAEALGATRLLVKVACAALASLGCLLFAAAAVTQRQAMRAAARGAARA